MWLKQEWRSQGLQEQSRVRARIDVQKVRNPRRATSSERCYNSNSKPRITIKIQNFRLEHQFNIPVYASNSELHVIMQIQNTSL